MISSIGSTVCRKYPELSKYLTSESQTSSNLVLTFFGTRSPLSLYVLLELNSNSVLGPLLGSLSLE